MAKKGDKRKVIGLVSEASGHRIYTTKNFQNTPGKLERRAFDPITRQHENYKETNKSLGRNEAPKRK